MVTVRRATFRPVIFIFAIILFTYTALLSIVNLPSFQDWLKAHLAKQTGYDLAGRLRLDALLRLNLSGVTASKGSKPVLQAERILIVITPLGFFSKTIHRLRLEKPTLYLELDELMKQSAAPVSSISLRHLNVEDCTLVLNLGSGSPLFFKSLAMNAQHLNLGQATGLNLRTEVPWLEGVVEVIVNGSANDKIARLRVEQQGSRPVAAGASGTVAPAALEAEITVSSKADSSLGVVATGKLNRMAVGDERFSGQFESRATLGANHQQADIDASFVATELPSQMDFLPIALPKGTSTGVLAGNFSLGSKKISTAIV